MKREFVMTGVFDRNWEQMGLTESDLKNLQDALLMDPKVGAVIPHLGGARKIRFGLRTHGKSGGVRIIYVDVVVKERIYLLTAYPKNIQENLTPEQKKAIAQLVKTLKEE